VIYFINISGPKLEIHVYRKMASQLRNYQASYQRAREREECMVTLQASVLDLKNNIDDTLRNVTINYEGTLQHDSESESSGSASSSDDEASDDERPPPMVITFPPVAQPVPLLPHKIADGDGGFQLEVNPTALVPHQVDVPTVYQHESEEAKRLVKKRKPRTCLVKGCKEKSICPGRFNKFKCPANNKAEIRSKSNNPINSYSTVTNDSVSHAFKLSSIAATSIYPFVPINPFLWLNNNVNIRNNNMVNFIGNESTSVNNNVQPKSSSNTSFNWVSGDLPSIVR
jgi:hypothetical protein